MFFWLYIFKDCIGRNDVRNLGYGGKSRYILVGRGASHIAGEEVC